MENQEVTMAYILYTCFRKVENGLHLLLILIEFWVSTRCLMRNEIGTLELTPTESVGTVRVTDKFLNGSFYWAQFDLKMLNFFFKICIPSCYCKSQWKTHHCDGWHRFV